jgi:Domain of unknown function (DUF1883)
VNFLHYDLRLGPDDVVQVTLDKQANVRLMDDMNFSNYKQGRNHHYYGGLAKVSPASVRPPHAGRWHLAIDLGGHAGTVTASVRVLS